MSYPIEVHLQRLDSIAVSSESASATFEFAQVMAAVQGMNTDLGATDPSDNEAAQISYPFFGRGKKFTLPEFNLDDFIKKIGEWISKLADKLTAIVKKLANGTSFSISVGTGVSVTVNFPAVGSHG